MGTKGQKLHGFQYEGPKVVRFTETEWNGGSGKCRVSVEPVYGDLVGEDEVLEMDGGEGGTVGCTLNVTRHTLKNVTLMLCMFSTIYFKK